MRNLQSIQDEIEALKKEKQDFEESIHSLESKCEDWQGGGCSIIVSLIFVSLGAGIILTLLEKLFSSHTTFLTVLEYIVVIISLFIVVAAIISFISDLVKINPGKKKIKGLLSQAQETSNAIDKLTAELDRTNKECERLFDTAYKNNDIQTIKELSELNYGKAVERMEELKQKQRMEQAHKDYVVALTANDFDKIKRIADESHLPEACIATADQLLTQDFRLVTKSEKCDICKKAQNYLKDITDNPDAQYLYAVSECLSASYGKREWQGVLDKLREAKANPQLDKAYSAVIDNFIKIAIDTLDEATRREAEYREELKTTYRDRHEKNNYGDKLSYEEMKNYLQENEIKWYSQSGVEKIQNDSRLTESQKEDLIRHLRIYG